MANDLIRVQSLKTASRLGFPINGALPLLDDVQTTRPTDKTVKRLLCLHAAAASAYGFGRDKAVFWLRQENVFDELATSERRFIENEEGNPERFKLQIEGMWALAWALGLVPQLDFGKDCDNKFVMLLPNLKTGESSLGLRRKIQPRPKREIFEVCDLAYCLHWSIRQAQLSNNKLPGKVQPYVVEERRRVLEWLLGNDEWDDVALDT